MASTHSNQIITNYSVGPMTTYVVEITWDGQLENWTALVHEDPAFDQVISPRGHIYAGIDLEGAANKQSPLGMVMATIIESV